MTITLRDALKEDIPAIFEVRISVRENHLSVEQMADLGITKETIRKALHKVPCIWVAESEGQILGFSMANEADACMFAAFARPEQEGQGIGRQLVARGSFPLERQLSIWLETSSSSRAAGLYEELGWDRTQNLENGYARFEKHRPKNGWS